MYLLDTDHMSILQLPTQPEYARLSQRMNSQPSVVFYVSIVSFHEQFLGVNTFLSQAGSAQVVVRGYEMLERVRAEYARRKVLLFDVASAKVFDSLRVRKVRVATMDLRIAATALSNNLTVLTRNLRDFTRVPGLKVEDWTT